MADNDYGPDFASLLTADEPTWQEQARARAQALRGRSDLGAILALTGDKAVAPLGQHYMGEAAHGQEQLAGLPMARQKYQLEREQVAKAKATNEAMQDPAAADYVKGMVGDVTGKPVPEGLSAGSLYHNPLLEKMLPASITAQGRREVAAQDQFQPITNQFGAPVALLSKKTGKVTALSYGGEGGASTELGGSGLTEEAKDQLAEYVHRTGQLPPGLARGRGAMALLAEIQNRVAQRHPTADLAGNKASYKADTGSLAALQKQADAVDAFESTAGKNLDQFLGVAKSVVDSGSPWINKPLRAISEKLLGSTDQTAFNVARQVAVTEIAKVLSNPGISGVLSDSARKEVQHLIGPDATLKQIYAAAQILKTDMANRKVAMQEQLATIRGRSAGKTPLAGAPSATAPASQRMQGKDGKWYVNRGAGWEPE